MSIDVIGLFVVAMKAKNKISLNFLDYYLKTNQNCFYRPQRSSGQVMYSQACVKNSVHGEGGLCPSMHHRSHDQGGSVWGGLWDSLSDGLCLGGLCLEGSLSGGLCLGGLCLGGSVRRPPRQRPPYSNERAVCILLECILVFQ